MRKQILKIDGIKSVIGTVKDLCNEDLKTAFYVKINNDDAIYDAVKETNYVYYPDYDNGVYIIGVKN